MLGSCSFATCKFLSLCDTDFELGRWVWALLYVLRRCGNFSLSLHPRRTFSSALTLRRENLLSSQTSLRRAVVRPSLSPSRASKQKAAAAAPCHNYGLRGLRSPKQAAQRVRQKAETHCCTKQTKGLRQRHKHGTVSALPWAGHDRLLTQSISACVKSITDLLPHFLGSCCRPQQPH